MNVPTMIVGIKYAIKPEPPGMAKAIKMETTIATIVENNTAMPVVIIVKNLTFKNVFRYPFIKE